MPTTKVVLTVPDISCEHCARVITDALEQKAGITSVEVDVSCRKVIVRYDQSLINPEKKMERWLEQTGYLLSSPVPNGN